MDRNRLRENRLNQLGYYLVFAGHTDRAIDVFRANVMFHPESWNCYDSLGEAYAFQGDIEQSLECYEKALELNPGDERISRILEELREHLRKDA